MRPAPSSNPPRSTSRRHCRWLWRPFLLSRTEQQAFLIVIAIATCARALQIFVPLFSSDDLYLSMASAAERLASMEGWIGQGRPIQAGLIRLQDSLGLHMELAGPLGGLLMTAVLAWTGMMIQRIWRVQAGLTARVCIALVFVLFPFWSNPFSFRFSLTTYALSLLLATWGVSLISTRRASLLPGTLLIFLSLWTFQTAFVLMVIVVLCAQAPLAYHGDHLRAPGVARWLPRWRAAALQLQFNRTAALVVAFFSYFGLFRLIAQWARLRADERTALLAFDAIPARIEEISELYHSILHGTHPLLSTGTALGHAGLLLLLVGMVATLLFKKKGAYSRWLVSLIVPALLAAFLLSPGFVMVSAVWWPSARSLIGFAAIAPAILALAFRAGRSLRFAHAAALFLGFAIAGAYAFKNQEIGADHWKSNQRDLAVANRMLVQIAQQAADGSVRQVHFIGTDWDFQHDIPTANFDMNVTGFAHPWSQRALLNWLSPRPFAPASPENAARAAALAPDMRPWPHPLSIHVENDCAFILLQFH